LIAWLQEVEDDPAADQRLGAEEHELLRTVTAATHVPARVRLRHLLLRRSVAGIVVGQLGFAWSLYVLMAWLPSYFRDVHGVSITHSGLLSAPPWLTMFVFSNVTGSVADWMIQRGVNVTTTRKLMQCGALLVTAALLLALDGAHSPGAALALLCGAAGALACTSGGHMPAYLDVAPRHGAVLFGFGNTFAQLPGIVGVAVTGWLVDITGTYSAAFVLTAIVSTVAALVFGLLVDARPIVD
jgi:MFS transporter, ACS family, solute carrier family 17 (sodium-dependent inorganic phosphate cotransporter), other